MEKLGYELNPVGETTHHSSVHNKGGSYGKESDWFRSAFFVGDLVDIPSNVTGARPTLKPTESK